MRFVEIGGI